jgi:two-component system, NtrC family, sensor kinase
VTLRRPNASKSARSRTSSVDGLKSTVAHLTRELNDAREQQAATADVLKVISRSAFDLQAVLDTLVESAARLCRADRASITLPMGDIYRRAASYGFSEEFKAYMDRNPLTIDRGNIVGRAVLEGKTVQVADVQSDPEMTYMLPASRIGNVRTILGVPMLREGVPVGVLVLTRGVVEPFTDNQIALVTTFADQAVIAVENARLLDELRQRTADLTESLEQQTATSEVLSVISSSPGELEPVFQAMLANATRICEAKFGILYRCEGDALRTIAMHDAPKPFVEARRKNPIIRPNPDTTLGRAMATKQPVQIADILEELDPLDARAAQLPKLAGARTVLAVPMLKKNELVGAFLIYRTEVRPFADKQIALIQNFAAQAVIAIENTRLLNELRQRTSDLTESLEQQTATSEVLSVISSSPAELEPVFQAILTNATRLCGAKFGTLNLYDGEAFRSVAAYNVPPEYADMRLRMGSWRPHLGTGHAAVVRTKQPVQFDDLRTSPAYLEGDSTVKAIVDVGGARTVLMVPMLKDDKLIGTIAIYRQEVSTTLAVF